MDKMFTLRITTDEGDYWHPRSLGSNKWAARELVEKIYESCPEVGTRIFNTSLFLGDKYFDGFNCGSWLSERPDIMADPHWVFDGTQPTEQELREWDEWEEELRRQAKQRLWGR